MTRSVPLEVHRAANGAHYAQARRYAHGRYIVATLPVTGRVRARCVHRRSDRPQLVHHVRSLYVVVDGANRSTWVATRFWCGGRSFTTERPPDGAGPLCVRCLLALDPRPSKETL